MSATGFLDACGFNPASGGTGDFVVSAAVTGYQTPAGAGAVNGAVYSYRAQSSDLSQWEIGYGAYATGTTTLARTTVTASSTGSKVNFSAPPSVYVTALTADFQNASLLNSGTVPAARLPAATTSTQGAVQLATSSDEATGTSSTLVVTPAVQQAHASAAKAWVNFYGSGSTTIRASYNVSSVVYNATGDYTVNFTSVLDPDFSAVASPGNQGGIVNNRSVSTNNQSSSACRVLVTVSNTAASFDVTQLSFVAFR